MRRAAGFSREYHGPQARARGLPRFRPCAFPHELSAGRRALWSHAAASARPSVEFIATALRYANEECASDLVEVAPADNARLIEFAEERAGAFDLIFASHTMCTCRCAASPGAYARALQGTEPATLDAAGRPVARTCGGVPLTHESVDSFVRAIAVDEATAIAAEFNRPLFLALLSQVTTHFSELQAMGGIATHFV